MEIQTGDRKILLSEKIHQSKLDLLQDKKIFKANQEIMLAWKKNPLWILDFKIKMSLIIKATISYKILQETTKIEIRLK